MSTFNSPSDASPGSLARSGQLNTLDAATATAFELLPTNAEIDTGTAQYAVDTGTANALLVALPQTETAYTDGMLVVVRPANTNTGAATIDVDSIGAIDVKTMSGAALTAGDLRVGVPIGMRYSSVSGDMHLQTNTASISGTVPVNLGGTGVITLADGGLMIGNGTSPVEVVAPGTTAQILVGGGAATAPAWGTNLPTAITIGAAYIYRAAGTDVPVTDGGTGVSTLTDGGLLVGAAASDIEALAVGLTSQILVGGGAGTNPAWGTDIPTAVTIGAAYIYRAAGTDIPVTDGGTGVSTLADGGLVIGNAGNDVEVVAAGTTSQILVGGGANTAPAWGTDIPTAVTIGSAYIYRVGGTDVAAGDMVTATESAQGASELATDAETITGTATNRVVTPANVTALNVGADIRRGGYYALQLQNIPDLAAKGQEYWFDGADDYISCGDSTDLEFSTKMSMVVTAKNDNSVTPDLDSLGGKYLDTGDEREYYFTIQQSGDLSVYFGDPIDGTFEGSYISTDDMPNIDNWHTYAFTYNAGTVAMYVDGAVSIANISTNVPSTLYTGSAEYYVGNTQFTQPNDWGGSISRSLLFNLTLTAAEVKAFSSGAPVPYKYVGASQTVINSGSFTIGKAYRIVTRTDGDFQSAGAPDDDVGTEFVATATAAGVLDGGDTAVRIGAVLQLEQPNMTPGTWYGSSGNDLDGTVSGPVLTNPIDTLYIGNTLDLTGVTDAQIPYMSASGFADSGFSFDGTGTYTFLNSGSSLPEIILETTNDTGTSSPKIQFFKNSASADGEFLGEINFSGLDSGSSKISDVVQIRGNLLDNTDGDESGAYVVNIKMDGTISQMFEISAYNGVVGQGETVFNETGKDMDFRVESAVHDRALEIIGSTGVVHLGADDKIGHMEIHDAGTLKFWDNSDDTSVALGPVANGTTELGFTGKLKISETLTVTGGQITFPATAVPSSDANTLDDYEEGTWTPTIAFAGSSTGVTYGTQLGYYNKIGNLVSVTGYVVLTDKGAEVGTATLRGFPFAVGASGAAYAPASCRIETITFANVPQFYAGINQTFINFEEVTEGGAVTVLTNANFADTSSIMVQCTYRID